MRRSVMESRMLDWGRVMAYRTWDGATYCQPAIEEPLTATAVTSRLPTYDAARTVAACPTTPATVRARCAFWLAYLRKINYLRENNP